MRHSKQRRCWRQHLRLLQIVVKASKQLGHLCIVGYCEVSQQEQMISVDSEAVVVSHTFRCYRDATYQGVLLMLTFCWYFIQRR